ncbi:MAG: helix-turn-helix domain-containing protein [Verrucomicrobia bacterium]|nr:helix-turn-helix domain-containing protein [Verrucomicrobiota bacterium]
MIRKPQDISRQRAEIILQVRSGQITATDAARLLGISRKTYYQWEQRALSGMLAGLENRDPGRPLAPRPDPETQRLKQKVSELEHQLKVMEQVHELRGMLAQLRPTKKPDRAVKPQSKTKSKRPSAGREKKT